MHFKKLRILAVFILLHNFLNGMETPQPMEVSTRLTTFEDLPLELQIHITQFITAPTPKEATRTLKAFLLTSGKTARFLSDESLTQSWLLKSQKQFNRSMLELARLMRSNASKKIAQSIEREAEKSLFEYTNIKDLSYAEFVFKNRNDLDVIPSLLYYVYSNHIIQYQVIYRSLYNDHISRLKLWIQSDILNHRRNLEYLWYCILFKAEVSKADVDTAKLLIDTGYNVNILVPYGDNQQQVKKLPSTLLDFVTDRLQLFKEGGISSKNEIINYSQILRMLYSAGAKSNYELQHRKS